MSEGKVVENLPDANPGSLTLQCGRTVVVYNGTTHDLALFIEDDLKVSAPIDFAGGQVVAKAEWMSWMFDCIESVTRAFDTYRDSKSPVDAAFALTELNDRISDLKSYHPGWDFETGTMPYDREEELD